MKVGPVAQLDKNCAHPTGLEPLALVLSSNDGQEVIGRIEYGTAGGASLWPFYCPQCYQAFWLPDPCQQIEAS